MAADGSIKIELKFNKDAYDKGIKDAENQAKNFSDKLAGKFSQGNSFLDKLGNGLTSFGGKLQSVGQGVTNFGNALAPISNAANKILTSSVKSASEFTDGMAKMSTLFDTTKYSVQDLSKQFLDLSSNTGVSATELAEAGYQALSAGQSVEQVGQFVETASNLARAGFTSTTTAVDVLTTAMNAYGESAGTAEEIANKLVRTQNLGKTTVDELASSMGKIIPTASSMNVNIDNLTAGYVALTKQGIATAEATTYMNSMLNELGDSGTTVGKTLKAKTGKSFQELMADGYSLADVLKILQDDAKESGTNFNELWGSAEAGKAALALLNGGVEEFNNTVDTMASKTDDVGEALDKLETPSVKIQKALNRVKNAGIELGTAFMAALAPTLDKIVSGVEKVTTWFSNLDEGTKTTIATILGVVAAASPVIVIIGKVISVIGSVITFVGQAVSKIKLLWGLFTAATGPVGIAIAIIVALVAAFVLLWNKSEAFRNFWINLWEKVKEACAKAADWIKQAWDKVVEFFTATVPEAFSSFVDFVVQKFNEFIEFFTTTVPQAVSNFVEQVGVFFGETLPYYIGYGIGLIIAKFIEWGNKLVTFVTVDIPNFINGVIKWFQQLPGKVWTWLLNTINKTSQWCSEMISKGTQAASQFLSKVISFIQQLPGQVWSWLTQTVSKATTFATNFANKAREAGNKFKTDLVNKVKEIPGQMVSIGSNIVSGIWNGISGAWGSLVSSVQGLCHNLVAGFQSALHINSPSKVFRDVAVSIPEGIAAGIEKGAHFALSAMNALSDNVVGVFDQSDLADRFALETGSFGYGGSYIGGNTYTVNQTINSAKELSPSEIAEDTKNAVRRLAWQ